MRMPLRLRVILLVTAFNLAVFGGGLIWQARRQSREREVNADVNEELVFERLRNRLDVRGRLLAGEILDWARWDRYDDAVIVQLAELEPQPGLHRDILRAARLGRALLVRRGAAIPLRRPPPPGSFEIPPGEWPRRGLCPPPVPLPTAALHCVADLMRAVRTRLVLPRLTAGGEVWGAAFVEPWRVWPWEVLSHAVYLGLSEQRQRTYDVGMSHVMRRALREARDRERVVELGGGVILPMTDRQGRIWGGAFLPLAAWPSLLPSPWFAPWRWCREAIVAFLPEFDPSPPLIVSGIFLNPLGSAHRPPAFDREGVLGDIRRAALEGERMETERGIAVPLRLASGDLWGGVWLEPRPESAVRDLVRELFPAFLISTLLLTLATFFGMRTLVLEPVRRLARGASRLAAGDLSARIPEVDRRDELADLVRSFNAMASQVEGFNARLAREVQVATEAAREAEAQAMTQRRLAATGELAAGIAHEINNPLGGMLNALEVLEREDLEDSRRSRYMELLRGGLERIRQTVGQVLRLVPREIASGPLSLVDPVSDALGLVRHRAAEQGTTLVLEGAGGPRGADEAGALDPWRSLPAVRGQPNELGQAVLNLLVNALDALEEAGAGGEDGGEVRVGLEPGEGGMHLWIADDGPGMDPELLPRAADPFFSTKDTGRGTGLGLAIVQGVVSAHGGRVWLSSPPRGGFRVDLVLPLAGDRVGGADGIRGADGERDR